MFFSITPLVKDNFSCHYRLGNLNVFTDYGWCFGNDATSTYVYKGYADDFDLSENIERILVQPKPQSVGNFCLIHHDSKTGQIQIKTDIWRSFPIFLHDSEITNLVKSDDVVWTDSTISVDQDFNITRDKHKVVGDIAIDTIPLELAINLIDRILQAKTQKFLSHNQLPIKAHLTGGVDSMLVFCLLSHNKATYELVRSKHFDYDRFWMKNETQISTQFWGYTQLHHWVDPCVLTSGAPGDEFMLRSPNTIDLLLKYRGLSTEDLLKQKRDTLHFHYFSKEKSRQLFQNQRVNPNLPTKFFYWQLCNTVINDWQHWHLGHTLTWTPLRDLEIFKIMLRLSPEDAIDQMFDSKLSKMLIEKYCPGMTKLISDQKNLCNPMKNLAEWLFQDAV
jgi:hypothetical protein